MTLKWKRVNKSETMNRNRRIIFDWFVERGWTNFMSEELSRNQTILGFDVILHLTIGWSNNAFSMLGFFLWQEMKSPCFDLFIHWLIKQITNTYQNHFQGQIKIALTQLLCQLLDAWNVSKSAFRITLLLHCFVVRYWMQVSVWHFYCHMQY